MIASRLWFFDEIIDLPVEKLLTLSVAFFDSIYESLFVFKCAEITADCLAFQESHLSYTIAVSVYIKSLLLFVSLLASALIFFLWYSN